MALLLAVVQLLLVSGSLLLAARLFMLPPAERDAFLGQNMLDPALRKQLLLQLCAAGSAPLLVAAGLCLWLRERAVVPLSLAAARLSPLILACFLPTLLNYRQWYDNPLPYLVMLLGVVLVLERLFEVAFSAGQARRPVSLTAVSSPARGPDAPPRRRFSLPLALVLTAASAYTLQASYYTIMRHQLLGTAGFDLGIFDNLMVNALHGRPFYSPIAVPNGSYLSNHAEYGMFLFAPLYALWPGPEFLLVMQSAMIGFAALPLYMFASTQLPRMAAAILAVCYLLYAPLHGPNYYDFHWMPVSMFFFFALFWAIATRRTWAIVLLTLVICSLREDAPFGLIAVGLFLIVTGYWPRLGAIMGAVAGVWFVVVKFVIMPWAGPWWFADIYKDLVAKGENGYGSVVKTILVNPNYFIRTLLKEAKLTYALHLFAPLGLLALRHPALGLLMIPGFIVTLMTTGYDPTTSITFQYTTHWIPFLFGAVVISLGLRGAQRGGAAQRASLAALCVGVVCHSYVFGAILQHQKFVGGFSRVEFEMTKEDRARYADLREVTSKIPKDASVAANELEVPHVSTRPDVYTLKTTAGDAEFLFLSRLHLDDSARSHIREAFHKAEYGLFASKGEFYLLRRGHKSPDTDSALQVLGLSRLRRTPEHHDPGSLVGPGGNCIAVELARKPDVFVRDCRRDSTQRWRLSQSDGRLRYVTDPTRCLGMPQRKNGDSLQAIDCANPAAAWRFEEIAIHGYGELCLDLLGGNQAAGAEIGVWDCLDNHNQHWTLSEQGEIRWAGRNGTRCLHAAGATDGTQITLQPCDGSEAQRFALGDNRIRHGDKCLDLRPKDDRSANRPFSLPENGWRVQLWSCDTAQWNQEFHLSGSIRQAGKCVDSRWGQTSDGSIVGTWDCVGNLNQSWDVHF